MPSFGTDKPAAAAGKLDVLEEKERALELNELLLSAVHETVLQGRNGAALAPGAAATPAASAAAALPPALPTPALPPSSNALCAAVATAAAAAMPAGIAAATSPATAPPPAAAASSALRLACDACFNEGLAAKECRQVLRHDAKSTPGRKRKRPAPYTPATAWTEEEHRLCMEGYERWGQSAARRIAQHISASGAVTRAVTPTQVRSHLQHHLRKGPPKRTRRQVDAEAARKAATAAKEAAAARKREADAARRLNGVVVPLAPAPESAAGVPPEAAAEAPEESMGGRKSALIDQQKQEQQRQQQLQEQQQQKQQRLEQQEIDRKWITRSSNLVRRTLQRLAGEDPSFKPEFSSPRVGLLLGVSGGLLFGTMKVAEAIESRHTMVASALTSAAVLVLDEWTEFSGKFVAILIISLHRRLPLPLLRALEQLRRLRSLLLVLLLPLVQVLQQP
ncbi:hypothetical protein JKP88DRAFT_307058 [Tribonema minus]|uniref:Myb-like domain-containing protein n=1 Tax=Tribonema minus TaxID=303371 RepID=A0A836CIS5_9STRA|nr:hypothetical protein JKP88DRAFT_307058 [Tribonema minus]